MGLTVRSCLVFATAMALAMPTSRAVADPCDGFEYASCGFVGCYYFHTATVTAGPTDCRVSRQKSTASASCPNDPSEDKCILSVSSTQVTKYSLSGSITYDKWGGLSAGYENVKTDVVECKGPWPIAVGGLSCGEEPYPPSQSCCKESWDRRRTTTKKMDVSCKWSGAGGDVGECNGFHSGMSLMCTEEGTLVEIGENNCGDCSNMALCP